MTWRPCPWAPWFGADTSGFLEAFEVLVAGNFPTEVTARALGRCAQLKIRKARAFVFGGRVSRMAEERATRIVQNARSEAAHRAYQRSRGGE